MNHVSSVSMSTLFLEDFFFWGTFRLYFHVCFFFFQAEDGIRDIGVTGVQTCALPIFPSARWFGRRVRRPRGGTPSLPGGECDGGRTRARPWSAEGTGARAAQEYVGRRSEERRVGKECSSRWWPYH